MKISKEELLSKLLMLRASGPRVLHHGICSNIGVMHLPVEILEKWSKYTGNNCYPVPDPELSPAKAFTKTMNLWDRSTKYGRNRWELVNFLIEELSKDVKSNKQG